MELYFLRHGDAGGREAWKGEDRERPLSEEGAARMRREAKTLAAMKLGVSLIVTSPFTRAVQTAEIVSGALCLPGSPVLDERLAPGFGFRALREVLAERAEAGTLLLVGHEPDFSATIAACIDGGRVECKKGSLARIDFDNPDARSGVLAWLLPPRVLAP